MATYAICIKTNTMAKWKQVVAALLQKHADKHPSVFTYYDSIEETRPALETVLPYYTCFVAEPEECDKKFVAKVLRLTRSLTPDEYSATLWGILTGSDMECALKIAQYSKPLLISNVLGNTNFPMYKCDYATFYSEGSKTVAYTKIPTSDDTPKISCSVDLAKHFSTDLNSGKFDLIITSAHASEHDWKIGYNFDAGKLYDSDNILMGEGPEGETYKISSPNPKVYIAAGNCLMGSVLADSCMATAWMNSCSVMQMIGYTEPSWFGVGGWNTFNYFFQSRGMFNLAQAYYANMQTMKYLSSISSDSRFIEGVDYDLDAVAFYGDPAWDARMPLPKASGVYPNTFEFKEVSQKPWTIQVITTGSGCWDGDSGDDTHYSPKRQPFYIFPRRLKNPKLIKGNAIVTSMFALFLEKGKFEKGQVVEVIIEEC